jgi:putative ABC transport system substrate-binding protein
MALRFTALAALAFLVLAAPLAPEAQQSAKVYRIGVLTGGSQPSPTAPSSLREGLRDLGWVEGKNIVFEGRYAEGKQERLPELAAELINLKVDVIVTFGTPAALAARKATSTVPIVLGMIGDPVRVGLVTSLARPGGNVTGNSLIAPELGLKRLELLKEAIPKAKRIGLPYDPANPAAAAVRDDLEAAARSLGMELYPIEVRHPDQLEGTFAAAANAGVDALLLFSDPVFFSARTRIMALALKHRLPSMSEGKEFVEAGGLISYSPSIPALARRAAIFIDKILRGARPADLPIEQPTTFELVINLTTAKALGLTIPPAFLLRADQVID